MPSTLAQVLRKSLNVSGGEDVKACAVKVDGRVRNTDLLHTAGTTHVRTFKDDHGVLIELSYTVDTLDKVPIELW